MTKREMTENELEQVRKRAYAAGYRDGWQSRIEAEQQEAYTRASPGKGMGRTGTGKQAGQTEEEEDEVGR